MSEVRDHRKPGWLWADRLIVKRDGAELGVYGVAVYVALCSFADENEQKCWPSHATLAKLLGGSRRKVERPTSSHVPDRRESAWGSEL